MKAITICALLLGLVGCEYMSEPMGGVVESSEPAKVVDVRILSNSSDGKTGNVISGGLVGYAIAGPVGAAIGASSAKSKPSSVDACFLVVETSSHIRHKFLATSEARCIASCALLRIGDQVTVEKWKHVKPLTWNSANWPVDRCVEEQ